MRSKLGRNSTPKLLVVAVITAASLTFLLIGQGLVAPAGRASSSGPAPTFTGAPGESNCTACHTSFDVNSGSGNVLITGLPRNYLPGQQVPITVTVNQSDGVLFGFQMTALDPAENRTGSYILPAASPPQMQTVLGFVNTGQREYVEHTINGITPSQFGTKSWQFNWVAPPRRVGKVSFFAAGNAADSDQSSSGDRIYTSSASILSGSAISNFDGDQRSDLAVYRNSEGRWYFLNSSDGQWGVTYWGVNGDVPVPGDYDADGVADAAVYRPSNGEWYVRRSGGGYDFVRWGVSEDIPVPGDYDGDLKTDLAVFRPSEGVWYILKSGGGADFIRWGVPSDRPVPGDYDGDAKTDIAVFRPSNGTWYVQQSSDGAGYFPWGSAEDVPVQGDYNGDGKYDLAVFRPSQGAWYVFSLGSGIYISGSQWGVGSDIPAPADFDGDGKYDLAVFRPSDGVWWTLKSSDNSYTGERWGAPGDTPISKAYLP